MTSPLDIRLLGPFEVVADGHPASVSGSKRDALLALLALRQGRVVTVDALVDALWGEHLPSAPRNAVQHHVARLRAALGKDAIVAAPDGYALGDATVDTLQFEELLAEARAALREGDARRGADAVASALGLWRGAPLHGLTDTPWFEAEAQRLEALRVDTLEEQFEAALALGQHREIVPALRRAVDESAFRERLWGQLMLALYRSGRQADALEAFQEARRVLSDELGLDPGPELRRLQEAILAQDPAIAAVEVPATRRGNLPAPATSFVGRERELALVLELLAEHRLVTLSGLPGVGKTRLALEAVRSLDGAIRDGAWLVELARAESEHDVVRLIAQSLDARGPNPLARVVARLRDGDAILVLDACEHVTAAARGIVTELLAECAAVRILATSREVLHVDGEVRVPVDPLPLPDHDETSSPAVELFVARARAARPGFTLTPDTAPIVAAISRRTDGLPLAIELAAARVGVLGLAELLALVERRLSMLGGRPATDAERVALRSLVEWSYDLLHADEKTLLHQLAVHRGGASLASLVALGATYGLDDATVTYLLAALVDKSVVSVGFPGGEARYDVLDTIREYAVEQLAASGGLDAARKAHAEYFASLAGDAHDGLRRAEWRDWLRRLEAENENLWAALGYAREAGNPEIAGRLGASLGMYFLFAERVSEGRRFLELAGVAVAEDAPLALQLELTAYLVYFAIEEGDLAAAADLGEHMLKRAAGDTDPPSRALLQTSLALAHAQARNAERAAALAEEAYDVAAAGGDPWSAAVVGLMRAQVAAHAGDSSLVATMAAEAYGHAAAIGYDIFMVPAALLEAWVIEQTEGPAAAERMYSRAVELGKATGLADHALFALVRLGRCALAAGDVEQAEERFRRALAGAESGATEWVGAYARVELGRVRAAAGDVAAAARLYRQVVDWSAAPRPHQPRETLFVALAGDPAAVAALGLTELGEATATLTLQ